MVQYVFTPWRNRQELLRVRAQFYSLACSPGGQEHGKVNDDKGILQGSEGRHHAVDMVSMWVGRGHCPHMVESTALLTAAVLSDEERVRHGRESQRASEVYSVKAAYSTAFSRFVTGLLDSHQDKLRKQSMYIIAKSIGLPATFVELRHQSTHEQLPSLANLRSAANKALDWIWEYYWKNLETATQHESQGRRADPIAELVLQLLKVEDGPHRKTLLARLATYKDHAEVLTTIKELQKTLPGNQAYIKCAGLIKEMTKTWTEIGDDDQTQEVGSAQPTASDLTAAPDRSWEVEDHGWRAYQGTWTPKPIGMV